MREVKKIIEMNSQNFSQRRIAESLKVSRNTVSKVLNAINEKRLYWKDVEKLTETEVQTLIFGKEEVNLVLKQPDFDYVHKELLRPGVTLKMLWEEYADQCRNSSLPFYHYSYFADLYRDYVKKHHLTMHIAHKPGDKMQVDWHGKTMTIHDRYTGEIYTAYLFEATLPFSMYSYVQACLAMDTKNWIECHVNAYQYFGGVTRLLIPDNLKTSVISHKKNGDPVINKSYQEMADHYDTVIIPTRVRAPRDKAAVEGSVGDCTIAINGKLRNRKFFSIDELNKAIREELELFNSNPFQKREGSRKQIYLEEEKMYMRPLPSTPFEVNEWKKAKVQLNYHIAIDKMYYSVPYEYAGNYVDVKIKNLSITVYYKGNQLCIHERLKGRKGQYSTKESHMPENHQRFLWNKERFLKWSSSIGDNTNKVVIRIFERYAVEEQAYNSCMSLLKLADKYSSARLENACELALNHVSKPGYKNIKMILESGQDIKENISTESNKTDTSEEKALVRGANYYGGKCHG